MALGVTMVDVIIKNMSNRNMMSVIDDIENISIAFVFLFIMDCILLFFCFIYPEAFQFTATAL